MRPKPILEGDNAAKWLPWAESKYRWLRQRMALGGRNAMWERHPLPDGSGKAYIASMFGQDEIRITASVGQDYLVLCGQAYDGASGQTGWRVERRDLQTGNLKWKHQGPYFDLTSSAQAITGSNGTFFVAGYTHTSGSHGNWRIEKRSVISGDILAYVEKSTRTNNQPFGISASGGSLYVCGITYSSPTVELWCVEKRAIGSLELLWEKEILEDAGGWNREGGAYGVAAYEPDDAIYVVGGHASTNYIDGTPNISTMAWRVEKRSAETGEVLWEYRTPTTAAEEGIGRGVCVDLSGVYVCGWRSYTAPFYPMTWRVEKRTHAGVLEWEHHYDSADAALPTGIVLDADYLYISGTIEIAGISYWRVEKRAKEDGVLVWSRTIIPDIANIDQAWAICMDRSKKNIIVGGRRQRTVDEYDSWIVEKRDIVAGDQTWEKHAEIVDSVRGTVCNAIFVGRFNGSA